MFQTQCVPGTVLETGDTAAFKAVSRKFGGWGEETENRQSKINVFRDGHDSD